MTKLGPCRYFDTGPEIISLTAMFYVRSPTTETVRSERTNVLNELQPAFAACRAPERSRWLGHPKFLAFPIAILAR